MDLGQARNFSVSYLFFSVSLVAYIYFKQNAETTVPVYDYIRIHIFSLV